LGFVPTTQSVHGFLYFSGSLAAKVVQNHQSSSTSGKHAYFLYEFRIIAAYFIFFNTSSQHTLCELSFKFKNFYFSCSQ